MTGPTKSETQRALEALRDDLRREGLYFLSTVMDGTCSRLYHSPPIEAERKHPDSDWWGVRRGSEWYLAVDDKWTTADEASNFTGDIAEAVAGVLRKREASK